MDSLPPPQQRNWAPPASDSLKMALGHGLDQTKAWGLQASKLAVDKAVELTRLATTEHLNTSFTGVLDGMVHVHDRVLAENERLIERLRTDAKTGLSNEAGFREDLGSAIEKQDGSETLVITIVDVNGFKAVNDKLGHEAGDRLLVLVARAHESVYRRKSDKLYHGNDQEMPTATAHTTSRLGGDEYAVMFAVPNKTQVEPKLVRSTEVRADTAPQEADDNHIDTGEHRMSADISPLEQADKNIEMVRTELLHLITETEEGSEFRAFEISLAAGHAEHQPGISPQELFAIADARMFEDKYRGKLSDMTTDDLEIIVAIMPGMQKLEARGKMRIPEVVVAAYRIATAG